MYLFFIGYIFIAFFAHCSKVAATAPDCYLLTGTNPAERALLSHWDSSKIPELGLVGPDWLALGQVPTH